MIHQFSSNISRPEYHPWQSWCTTHVRGAPGPTGPSCWILKTSTGSPKSTIKKHRFSPSRLFSQLVNFNHPKFESSLTSRESTFWASIKKTGKTRQLDGLFETTRIQCQILANVVFQLSRESWRTGQPNPNIWLVKKSRRRLTRCTVLELSWYSSTNLWATTVGTLLKWCNPMPSPVSGLLQGRIHRLCLESNVPHTNFSLHAASDLLVYNRRSSFGKFGVMKTPGVFFSSGFPKTWGIFPRYKNHFWLQSSLLFTLGMLVVDSPGSSMIDSLVHDDFSSYLPWFSAAQISQPRPHFHDASHKQWAWWDQSITDFSWKIHEPWN